MNTQLEFRWRFHDRKTGRVWNHGKWQPATADNITSQALFWTNGGEQVTAEFRMSPVSQTQGPSDEIRAHDRNLVIVA